jgi:hypothetical protein
MNDPAAACLTDPPTRRSDGRRHPEAQISLRAGVVPAHSLDCDSDLLQRREVLKRTLRALPDSYLVALINGLELHRHELVPGRLYRDSRGRGCVVGALLRELHPSDYAGPAIVFWIRHGWRKRASSYRENWAKNPRLGHLELTFDRTVARLRALSQNLSRQQASSAIGEWFLAASRNEIACRAIERAFSAPAAEPVQRDPSHALYR